MWPDRDALHKTMPEYLCNDLLGPKLLYLLTALKFLLSIHASYLQARVSNGLVKSVRNFTTKSCDVHFSSWGGCVSEKI